MRERVRETIRRYRLLERGDGVVIGVSGGPDSMALLHLLLALRDEYDLSLSAVHVHHQLRGAEADADAAFVADWCRAHGVPCRVVRVDVRAHAAQHRLGLQVAARQLRYAALREAAERAGAGKIALGHHADDQVETVLMRLVRGTGIGGLAGIPIARAEGSATLIRPLLHVRRAEIEAYCAAHGVPYRLDASNRSRAYLRNRVRLDVVPLLSALNPRFPEAVCQLAEVARAEDAYLEERAREALEGALRRRTADGVVLDRRAFVRLPLALQRRVIKLILSYLCVDEPDRLFAHIEAVRHLAVSDKPAGSHRIAGAWWAETDYDVLVLRRGEPDSGEGPDFCYSLAVPGETQVPEAGCTIRCRVTDRPLEDGELSPLWAVFDYERLSGPLVVRARRPGDRMTMWGLVGHKKVKDILIDEKVPHRVRRRIPVICAGETILWLPGVRRSAVAPVTAATRRFLYMEVENDA